TSTSRAPGSRASRRAVASPIPLDAPVTSITRGLRSDVEPASVIAVGPAANARQPPVSLSDLHPMSLPASSGAAARVPPHKRAALELFSGLPRRYDSLSSLLSFGQDPRWRRALVDAVAPAPGQRILDVATGTGMVAAELLGRCGCTVVGLDQSPQMLAAARGRFAGREDVELVQGEAEALPFADASFDALTFTYLLRYVDDPRATMRELARVVRPGGRVGSLEFGLPVRLPARAAWRFYTAIGLPTLGRIASREWGEVG